MRSLISSLTSASTPDHTTAAAILTSVCLGLGRNKQILALAEDVFTPDVPYFSNSPARMCSGLNQRRTRTWVDIFIVINSGGEGGGVSGLPGGEERKMGGLGHGVGG